MASLRVPAERLERVDGSQQQRRPTRPWLRRPGSSDAKPDTERGEHGGCSRGAAGRLPDPGDRRADRQRHAGGDPHVPREELHGHLTGLQQKVSRLSLCFGAKTLFSQARPSSRPGEHKQQAFIRDNEEHHHHPHTIETRRNRLFCVGSCGF